MSENKAQVSKYFTSSVECFKKKEFHRALLSINSAINLVMPQEPVAFFYLRGEIYRHLGKHKHSCEDGKTCVRLDKTYPGGYLLQAHYAISIGKYDKANSFVDFAKKFILKSTRNWTKEYQQALDALPKEFRGSQKKKKNENEKPLNIFEIFPHEIIVMIFSRLKFHDLVSMTCVKRDWYKLITEDPYLWQSINIPSNAKVVANTFISYVKRSKGKLRELNISGLAGFNDRCLHCIMATKCSQLQSITIRDCGICGSKLAAVLAKLTHIRQIERVNSLGITKLELKCSGLTEGNLESILKSCENLESLTLENESIHGDSLLGMKSSLKHLKLVHCINLSSELINHLLVSSSKSLQCLEMSYCNHEGDATKFAQFEKLERLFYNRIHRIHRLRHLIDVPETLTSLSIDSALIPRASLSQILQKSRLLTYLDVSNTCFDDEHAHYLWQMSNLRILRLLSCSALSHHGVETICSFNLPLEYFDVSFIPNISDLSIEMFSQFPNLAYLIANDCNGINGLTLVKVVEACTKLRKLSVERCRGINNETVEKIKALCKQRNIIFSAKLS